MPKHIKPSCSFSLSNQNSACNRLLIRSVCPCAIILNILGIHKERTTERSGGGN